MGELTDTDSYFEDFTVGQKIRHARGTTIDEVENQLLTNQQLKKQRRERESH